MLYISSKESCIGCSDFFIGVSNGTEHPLSDCFSASIHAEEVVEDSGIDGPDGLLLEVVVVGFNFGALVVVGVVNKDFN